MIAAVVALLVAMSSTPLAYGDVNYGCSNSSIVSSEPVLKSISSMTLTGIHEGQHLVISTTVSDRCGIDHPTIVILEVRDSNNVTVFLGLQDFTMKANSQAEVAVSWVPIQGGEYQLRAFTLVSFDSLGSAKVTTSKIDVAESNYAIVVIPYDPDPSLQQSNFEPNFIKVILGVNSTVVWTNADAASHKLVGEGTLVFDFEDPTFIYPSNSFLHTFTETGLFEYHDKTRPWMRGLVQVFPSDAVDARLDLSIKGLKGTYALGEPVEFTADMGGYETGCGTFEARVDKIGASSKPFGRSWMTILDCTSDPSFREIDYRFPFRRAEPFSIPVNETGTYRVTASFEGTIASASAVQEFKIS